jgi:hypothetical protein
MLATALLLPARTQAAASGPSFSSARRLLLRASALPRGYRYRGYSVEDSVASWDGGIRPVMAIDERNGWLQGAEEFFLDPRGYDAGLSVQIFATAKGARADFEQFFTNSHPETIYLPGSTWLGGRSVSGLGDRATLYRISDATSRCPEELTAGLTFVYRNGIFSSQVCLRTGGEKAARDLARRLLSRARAVAARGLVASQHAPTVFHAGNRSSATPRSSVALARLGLTP